MLKGFSVYNRNPGHWDIWDETLKKRIYRIHGEVGDTRIFDEINGGIAYYGKTDIECMTFLAQKFMSSDEKDT